MLDDAENVPADDVKAICVTDAALAVASVQVICVDEADGEVQPVTELVPAKLVPVMVRVPPPATGQLTRRVPVPPALQTPDRPVTVGLPVYVIV